MGDASVCGSGCNKLVAAVAAESQSNGNSYGYAYESNGNRTSKTYGISVDTYINDDADLTSIFNSDQR